MRLRTRLALISAAAVAVVVVVAVLLAQTVARQELLREIDESVLARAAEIERFPLAAVELFVDEGESGRRERGRFPAFGPDAIFGRGTTGFDALFVQILTPTGDVIVPPDQPVTLPVDSADYAYLSTGQSVLRTVEVGDDRIRMATTPLRDGFAVQVGRSLSEFEETLQGVTGRLTLAGAAGVALAALLGLVVARSALRPVDELTQTVEHVAQTKELTAKIEVDRDDEVGRLASSFNSMMEALANSQLQQQQLVRDAGHELRTPLTALRTNIELLARARNPTDEQRTELLEAAMLELRELTELAAELVELAADPSVPDEPMREVDLAELAERVVERFRRRTSHRIELESEPFLVSVSLSAIERAVGNLVDNAVKWSPADGVIEVEATGGRVTVRDHGPGISTSDMPYVFDRFFRSDEARTTPGSGLGLAIVKKIVSDHGGEVFVEPADGAGVRIGFTLPPAGPDG